MAASRILLPLATEGVRRKTGGRGREGRGRGEGDGGGGRRKEEEEERKEWVRGERRDQQLVP